MANRISKKHHYLPRCYLKGFTHNGKQLFIYDKQKDVVRPGNIDNSFILWGRNTIIRPDGSRTDVLEDLYAEIESQSAYLFPKIINSTPDKVPYTILDKLMLGLFIASLFWRVPGMDSQTRQLIQNEGFRNRKFHIEYPDGWSVADRQRLELLLLKEPVFQKFYPLMLTFEPFFKKNFSSFLDDWKFYYHDPGRAFASDRPLITRRESNPEMVLNEFVLPLSPNRVLVASKGNPSRIESNWMFDINFQLIYQAERYVCSDDKEFLKAMVSLYKKEQSTSQARYYKENVFAAID